LTTPPIIVVGSGIAGLWTALRAAPAPVLLLTAGGFGRESSSEWAQGGIAAALGEDDCPAQHAEDTIAAGAGGSDPDRALELAERVIEQVEALGRLGVPFERRDDGSWALSREAAHGRSRVARIGGDRAGAAIVERLVRAVSRADHVTVRPNSRVAALLADEGGACSGVVVEAGGGRLESLPARAVALATGGIGGLYALSTNPPGNRGQGLAWAAGLGAAIRDAEFVQFHPTALDVGRSPAPLATEALRGEGAWLVDRRGRRFMAGIDPRAELAPRDVVARAVHRQLQSGEGAFLDARQAVGEAFPTRFEAVFRACMTEGLDPRRQPIPVAPAAHYHMGGIDAGLDGRTGVERLFAVGEVACTGVHGANRLASNSLAEALVMGGLAGEALRDSPERPPSHPGSAMPRPRLSSGTSSRLRRAMSEHAGVERDARGLAVLIELIDEIEGREGAADELVVARRVAEAALARRSSLGAHWRVDDPGPVPVRAPGGEDRRGSAVSRDETSFQGVVTT
jgi:L-aspartate oxidase